MAEEVDRIKRLLTAERAEKERRDKDLEVRQCSRALPMPRIPRLVLHTGNQTHAVHPSTPCSPHCQAWTICISRPAPILTGFLSQLLGGSFDEDKNQLIEALRKVPNCRANICLAPRLYLPAARISEYLARAYLTHANIHGASLSRNHCTWRCECVPRVARVSRVACGAWGV